MKTKMKTSFLLLSLSFLVLACSKTETNDMMFKRAVSDISSVSPSPGESSDPTPEPSVVMEDPAPVPAPTTVVEADLVPPTTTVVNVQNPPASDAMVVLNPPAPTAPTTVTAPSVQTPPAPESTVVQNPPTVQDPPVLQNPTVVQNPPVVQNPSVSSTVQESEYRPYPESEIPVCKIDLHVRGLGAAAKVAVVSASKVELKSQVSVGFESLSSAELQAMRDSVDSMKSSASVQVVSGSSAFNKDQFKNTSKVLVVVDGKDARYLDLGGLGKDAQILIMVAAEGHNTLCLRTDGNSSMNSLSVTVLGDMKYVARADVSINGNGSENVYMKVIGGHQTGSKYDGKALLSTNFKLITEGMNDTFSSVSASGGIKECKFDVSIKGKNDTGWGLTAQHMTDSEMKMELQGDSNVKSLMDINSKLENTEFSGWIKEKTELKTIADLLDLMPVS